MRPALLLACVVVMFAPAGAWPQGDPLGPEFRLNTYTTGAQRFPFVASAPSGNFVVVWQSDGQDGSYEGVFGQRYTSSGVALGTEFRVNTYTTFNQDRPSAAADGAGNFVVVWQSGGQDGSYTGVFGQRYSGSGGTLGSEFRVNSYTTGSQSFPSVAADGSGNFVVAWQGASAGGPFDIFAQRFSNSGAPLGPEFRVNTVTQTLLGFPSVAADTQGNFVVVWPTRYGLIWGISGQRYASSGAPLGSQFQVSTYPINYFYSLPVAVAAGATGNFVVVWTNFLLDGSNFGVFGQRYDSSGMRLGAEFGVNTYTTNAQVVGSVAADALGDFVVVWSSYTQDGSGHGMFGQRYASSGSSLGPEFRVNTYTTSNQLFPSVAADDASGNFIVVWQGMLQDGSAEGVFGQRYGPIFPAELTQFQVE